MNTNTKKVIVIGSGFGGLSIAIRLQAKGYHVTIYEKNDMVGGHASQYTEKGYTFDLGPSIITAPMILDELFGAAGKKKEDYVKLLPIDPYYRIYYADGTHLDYRGETESMRQQLASFDPSDGKAYDRFIEYTKEIYKYVIEDKLGNKPFDNWKDFLSFAPAIVKLQGWRSTYDMAASYFKDERSRFAFSFHPLFLGGNPFTTPAIFLMIPYLEKVGGVWFAEGGMYGLVTALKNVFTDIGGQISLNSPVEKIEVKNGTAVGVWSQNEFFPANIVVSNAHSAHTYKDLISSVNRTKWTDTKVRSQKYSMSTVLLYLGISKKYPDIPHHSIILSPRYRGLIEEIFAEKDLPDDFSIYMHMPSRTVSDMAPEGCESMYALIPTPNLNANIDWTIQTEPFVAKVLSYLEHEFGMTDLSKHIEVQKVFTPLDFEQERNNYLGSPWSVQPSLLQIANFRPHNKSEDIKNLYLVGASTHPGGGVPGVMMSAAATKQAILHDSSNT